MILTFIFIFMILLGIILIMIGVHTGSDVGASGGAILVIFGGAFLIISVITIITEHAFADKIIQRNKMQYEGLCKRYEIIKSEYEDVSKSDVISDITEWNISVYNTKYWSENQWTNWFNPKKIADNLYYISLDEENENKKGEQK